MSFMTWAVIFLIVYSRPTSKRLKLKAQEFKVSPDPPGAFPPLELLPQFMPPLLALELPRKWCFSGLAVLYTSPYEFVHPEL